MFTTAGPFTPVGMTAFDELNIPAISLPYFAWAGTMAQEIACLW
jgi:hypothetical protein